MDDTTQHFAVIGAGDPTGLRKHMMEATMTRDLKSSFATPFLLVLVAGLAMNIGFFVPLLPAQVLVLFCVAPLFYALLREDVKHQRFLLAVTFFAAWQIPTCLWYFNVFPAWLAGLMIVGNILLLAQVVLLPGQLGVRKVVPQLLLIVVFWTLLVGLRAHLPFTSSWVVPNLTSTQWLNPIVVQVARLGEFSLVVTPVVALNALWAWLLLQGRMRATLAGAITVVLACTGFNAYSGQQSGGTVAAAVIGVQVPITGPRELAKTPGLGVTDEGFRQMTERTKSAISKYRTEGIAANVPLFVVWPENDVQKNMEPEVVRLAKEEGVYVGYHVKRPSGSELPFGTAVIVGPSGIVLENNKRHAAPSELITESLKFSHVVIEGLTVLGDICYDLHFPDISERLAGADLLLAPVDDDRFGDLFPYLHAADAVYRAAENNINIATASTNGPTFFVRGNGFVAVPPLPLWSREAFFAEVYR